MTAPTEQPGEASPTFDDPASPTFDDPASPTLRPDEVPPTSDDRVSLTLRPGVGPPRPTRGADLDPDVVAGATSYADLLAVVEQLHLDHDHSGSREWHHHTLGAYLEALGVVLAQLPSEFEMAGEPFPQQPTWGLLAQLLVAATDWE